MVKVQRTVALWKGENIGRVNRRAEHYKVVWVVVKDCWFESRL